MSDAAQMPLRGWPGAAFLSLGFRPFFLGGAAWAVAAMALWVLQLAGGPSLPTAFDPTSWHAHAFVFGYLGAIVAGFLLTAVPNWTGRVPLSGWPLAALFGLWCGGRMTVAVSALLPPIAVALVDLAFPVALGALMLRDIVAGQNWRNLMVLALLAMLAAANALFHWEAAQGDYAAQGIGLRWGVATGVMMIAVIGGRIVPAFTRNWLKQRAAGHLPPPPMQRFDKLSLLVLMAALAAWVGAPDHPATSIGLLGAGGLHCVRLSRWRGAQTAGDPLVWVLHLAYAMVPLGAIVIGLQGLGMIEMMPGAGLHVWMAGAIGLMTLAVMTRATLGHTGQALRAGAGTLALYLCICLSIAARVFAGFSPAQSDLFYHLSALCWMAGFGGFVLLYGPALLMPRRI